MSFIEEIKLASKFDARGFRQAESASAKLNKTITNLGKAVGITFAAQQVVNFGKSSVRAFIADNKAATLLANTMKNLGLQMSAPSVDAYIQSLEKATGVADDQLRPAMQTLLQVTGSVTNSQKILAQAIEASRATGIELTTVAQDLGQAYVGNTKGLRKYSLGLTQAELKAASFTDISARFTKLFGGANEAYLTTYAGQMERLGVAAGEAQETIGKGLVDALITLSGSKGIDDLVVKMDHVAQTTANIIGSVSRLISVTGGIFKFETGAQAKARVFGNKPAVNNITPQIAALVQSSQEKKAEIAALKRSQELTKDKKTQLAIEKAKAALAKAQANFDISKINLAAALKGKVSEDDKNRLLALQAIENGNGEEALKWIAKIDAAREDAAKKELDRQKLSYEDALAKIKALNAAIESRQAYLLGVGMGAPAAAAASSSAYTGPNAYDFYNSLSPSGQADLGGYSPYMNYSSGYASQGALNINLNVDGATIANAVYNASNSGTSSVSGRATGTFSV
jgi:hypothetical protein